MPTELFDNETEDILIGWKSNLSIWLYVVGNGEMKRGLNRD